MAAPGIPPAPPDVLVTSRPLDEYCALFGLTRARLAALPGPLLDCPGGAAGLAAEARELGCRVIAADPAYALPPPVVAARARAARAAMAAAMAARPHLYPYPAPRPHRAERYLRSWDRARRLFAADSAAHPQRYVAAELPRLPFADGVFALTLSGHLLFAYPELFGPERQLAALAELVRVTSPDGEVRVQPLCDGPVSYTHLAAATSTRCGTRSASGGSPVRSTVSPWPRAAAPTASWCCGPRTAAVGRRPGSRRDVMVTGA